MAIMIWSARFFARDTDGQWAFVGHIDPRTTFLLIVLYSCFQDFEKQEHVKQKHD